MSKDTGKRLSKKEIISYGMASPAVNIGALICGSFLSMYFTDIARNPGSSCWNDISCSKNF